MKIENIFEHYFFKTTNLKLQFHKKDLIFFSWNFFSSLKNIFFGEIRDQNGGLVFSIQKKNYPRPSLRKFFQLKFPLLNALFFKSVRTLSLCQSNFINY